MNFITELLKRWKLATTDFHKKLSKVGAWLSGTGVALIGIPAAFNTLVDSLNIKLEKEFDLSLLLLIASYMILAGLITSAVAKTAVEDPKKI